MKSINQLFRVSLILLLLAGINTSSVKAQCNFTSAFATFTMPSGTTTTITTCQFGGEYATGNSAVSGQTYTYTSSVATDWCTVRSGTSGGAVVAFGQVPLTFVATSTGTLYFHCSTNSSCGTASTCRTTTISNGATFNPCATIYSLASCGVATSTTIASGNGAYALGTWTPPGKEAIYTYTPTVTGTYTITQNSNTYAGYVDYFFKASSSGCNGSGWTFIQDLYGTTTSVGFSMTAGTQYYIMLDPEHTVGTTTNWTLNCPCAAPTVPVLGATSTTICNPGSTTLSITSGTLNSATTWSWYAGSCGSTVIGTGTSLVVSPTSTTTYYARGTGGCITPGSCGSVTINVNQPPAITTQPVSTATICAGSALNLSVSANNAAGYQWYKNSAPITGATSSTYSIPVTSTGDAGTYYVVVLGTSPCTNVTSGNSVVTINPPVAIATQPTPTSNICAGSPLNLSVTASNTTSYQWYKNSNPISGATSSTYSIPVTTLTDAGTYYVVIGAQTNCSPATSANAVVNIMPRPTGVLSVTGPNPLCNGSSTTMSVALTGTGPWTITFSDGSTVNTSTNPYVFNYTPAGSTTYSIVSLSDVNCSGISSDFAGSIPIVVNPRPTATLTVNGASLVCDGTPTNISVALTGTAPWIFNYFDGTTTTTVTTSTSPYTFTVAPSSTTTYSITSLSDANCTAIGADYSSTGVVSVNPRPTATVTNNGSATICDGSTTNIDISLTGTGPWNFDYFDGTTTTNVTGWGSNVYNFPVNPNTTTTYSVTVLSDANCTGQPGDMATTATVTVNYPPTIITQPAVMTACSGVGTMLSVSANGTSLSYQWRLNGGALSDNAIYSGTNTNILTISDITGLSGGSYDVVITGVCPPLATSTPVTVIEDFNNNWNGANGTAWSNPTNWSCGTVPIVTTNVLIPTGAINMPLVDIPTAICNSLTIQPSASVMFTGVNNALEIKAATVNGGTFDASMGRVILSGSGSQNIPNITYRDLFIDGGSTKTVDGPVTVTSMLNLISGYVVLNGNDLTLDVPVQTLGGSSASFIVTNDTGVIVGRNMGMGGNPDAAMFHVGTATNSYTPIMLENVGTADDFSVRVMPNVYQDGYGVNPLMVSNPVADRTWLVDEAVPGGSYVNMNPYWNAINEINGFTQAHVYVVHYMGGAWIGLTDSALGSPAAGTFGALFYADADSISSFSPFAVASSGQFPLAIKLNNITAINAGMRNRVNWTSAMEATGDKYEVERSIDGRTFAKIGTVAAIGTPSAYTFWDETAVTGKNYYRLRLVDVDGKLGYSNVVSATVKGGDIIFSVSAHPNPVENMLTVIATGSVSGKASVVLTDLTGKVVKAAMEMNGSALDVDMSDMAPGVYFIKYSDDKHSETIKINKQ